MTDADRALLVELRRLLLQLHKTLIEWQRADYAAGGRYAEDLSRNVPPAESYRFCSAAKQEQSSFSG